MKHVLMLAIVMAMVGCSSQPKVCQECKEWQAVKPLIERNIKSAEEDMAAFYVWFHTRELEPVGDEPEDHDRYQRNKRWVEVRQAIDSVK